MRPHLPTRLVSLALLAVAIATGACTGADTTFQPGIDGGTDAPTDMGSDGNPGFLLIVPETDLNVMEGQVTSFTVSLSAAPTQPVSVTLTRADMSRLNAPSEITFDEDNWATPQSVSVTALGDADAAPNDVVITLSAPGAADDVDVTVHVADDDTLAIHTTVAQVEVTEGFQATVKVKLTAEPAGDTHVAIALAPALPGVASVSPPELTFTAATWDVEQDVVITAEQDLDVAGATSTLTLTSAPIPTVSLPVTVFDDDVVGIDPSPTNLGTIDEGGAGTPLAVRLTRDPGGAVRVTATASVVGKITTTPGFLDFNSSNWNVAQSMTVAGAQDPDTRDDSLNVDLSSPNLVTRHVSVTVRDNDTPTIEANAAQVTVTEGNTVMLGVRLSYDPLGPVTITAASDNPAVATIMAGGTLNFDSANYNTYQFVTIKAEQDDDLAQQDSFVSLQATALGAMLDVPVHKPDDDQQVIETNMSTVSLSETGQASFNVRLRYRPSGNVTVGASVGGSPNASVAPTSINFTVGNYNTYQPVTVTGTHDVDLVPATVPVTLSGAAAPAAVTVTATVTDVDMQAIQASTAALTVTEGGTTSFTVRLAFQPAGTISVGVMAGNMAVATVNTSSLSFNATTWATPQTVIVTGAEDANATTDTTSVSLTSTGVPTVTVGVTANDNDTQGLEVSASSLSVTEGQTAMLGVRLRQDPGGNVTVSASSLDPAVIGLTGTTMFTFTSGNYTTYQYVTVDALQDPDLAVGSGTVRFASVSPALTTDVGVTKPDDDTQAIDTSVGSVTLSENGTAQFGVRLRYQPAGNVAVTVATADASKATAGPSLTFDPGSYATYQMVTVTGTDDLNLAAESVAINLTSPGNAPAKVVNATVNDDDMQVILGAPASISLTEGQQTTFNVRLMYQPLNSVTISLSASPTMVVGLSGNLTFTTSNWQTTQPVTVTALQDVDINPGSTTLSLSGGGATTVTVPVSVTDNDTLTIVPSTSTVSVSETGTSSFTVALSNQPNAGVTVSLALSPTGVANLSASSLSFTTSNWNTPQTVNVTPVADADDQTESTTVTLSSGVTGNATVGITVTDNTVVSRVGWPTQFSPVSFSGLTIWAYKVTTLATGTSWALDDLDVITGAAGGSARLAIYADNGDKPGALVYGTASTAMVNGVNTIPTTATTLAPNTVYWIAIAVSPSVSIGDGGLSNQVRRCQKSLLAYTDPWPGSFGTSSCTTTDAINVYATMHQ